MGSSRFPGKPLEKLLGMPMVEHCFNRAKLSNCFEEVFIATCDSEISNLCKKINAKVIMTSSKHERATDRTSEAIRIIQKTSQLDFEVVVMIQGDEPLVSPVSLKRIVDEFDNNNEIVNLISPFKDKESFADYNNVKVVFDKNLNALYFSREPIPSKWKGDETVPMYNQVGVIAFKKKTLENFLKLQETTLEKIESVDMNRLLEHGIKIKLVKNPNPTLGVDNKKELKLAEKLLFHDEFTKLYLQ